MENEGHNEARYVLGQGIAVTDMIRGGSLTSVTDLHALHQQGRLHEALCPGHYTGGIGFEYHRTVLCEMLAPGPPTLRPGEAEHT